MTTVIACGLDQGQRKAHRCPCCGYESNDIESFATSSCWACAFAMNLHCERCIALGVGINRFRAPRAKLHRLRRMVWTDPSTEAAIAMCGFRIAQAELGQATAAGLTNCKHCWPEGRTW